MQLQLTNNSSEGKQKADPALISIALIVTVIGFVILGFRLKTEEYQNDSDNLDNATATGIETIGDKDLILDNLGIVNQNRDELNYFINLPYRGH